MTSAAPPAPPAPATPPGAPETPSGFRGFLERETAGMPNWVWMVIIPVGLIAALFIRNRASAAASGGNSGNGQLTDNGGQYGNPYAGALGQTDIPNFGNQFGQTAMPVTIPYYNLAFGNIFGSATETFTQGAGGPEYVTVTQDPAPGSTLASIAYAAGISVSQLISLNPGITSTKDIIPGTQIRIY